jgi:3-hydroxyisobutyrate dehydrogenase
MSLGSDPGIVSAAQSQMPTQEETMTERDGQEQPAVAFVGLGNMGWPMASHLVAAGFPLVAVDADAGRQARFTAEVGGTGYSDPGQLSAVCAVVLMLPNGTVVRDALLGSGGLVAALPTGAVVIDMSSSAPADTRALAGELSGHKTPVVDAPVSGGVARAVEGTLTIMLGADDEAAAALAERVVAPLSRDIVRTGAVGTGHAMKVLNNFVAATSYVATSEALIAGERWGLTPEVMVQVINTSTGRSFSSENVMPTVLSGEFLTGFALGLLNKDVGIAQGVFAQAGIESEVCDAVRARLSVAEGALGAGADHARAYQHWHARGG